MKLWYKWLKNEDRNVNIYKWPSINLYHQLIFLLKKIESKKDEKWMSAITKVDPAQVPEAEAPTKPEKVKKI